MTGIEIHRFGGLVLFIARDRIVVAHASWGEVVAHVSSADYAAQKRAQSRRWRARQAALSERRGAA